MATIVWSSNCPSLQLPTLSRGTTVAVYTNVTADHLDRHGSVPAYRRVKRLLAERVDPDGALVLNLDDPVVAAYAGLGTAPGVLYRLERPIPGGVGDRRRLDRRGRRSATARWPEVAPRATGPGGRIMPIAELAIPGRHNVSNAMAGIATALLFGVAPDAIRREAAAFTGVEHRLETVAVDRRHPVRQRLAGHPARRGYRGTRGLPGTDRAHRGRPRQGRRPRAIGTDRGRACARCRPDRRIR